MKKTSVILAALVLGTGAAFAEDVAPTAVVYTDGEVAESLSGVPGDLTAGRKAMNRGAGNCVACHMVSDLTEYPFHGEVGPSLDGVADRWEEAQLRGIVANAKMMFPDTMMPAFYKVEGFIRPGDGFTGKAATEIHPLLTAQQIEDIVAYLLTLKE